MYSILILIAGILQCAMASFNGMLSDSIALIPMSFIVHASGGLLLILYIIIFAREKISIKGMPWYLYSAGFMGLTIVCISGFCIGHIGAAFTTCLSVTGQLLMSTVVDHFGLFGFPKNPFNIKRIPAFILILAGIIILNIA